MEEGCYPIYKTCFPEKSHEPKSLCSLKTFLLHFSSYIFFCSQINIKLTYNLFQFCPCHRILTKLKHTHIQCFGLETPIPSQNCLNSFQFGQSSKSGHPILHSAANVRLTFPTRSTRWRGDIWQTHVCCVSTRQSHEIVCKLMENCLWKMWTN